MKLHNKDLYCTHKDANTVRGLILALETMEELMDPNVEPILASEDALVTFDCTDEEVPFESEEGELLVSLGFHVNDDGYWSYTV